MTLVSAKFFVLKNDNSISALSTRVRIQSLPSTLHGSSYQGNQIILHRLKVAAKNYVRSATVLAITVAKIHSFSRNESTLRGANKAWL